MSLAAQQPPEAVTPRTGAVVVLGCRLIGGRPSPALEARLKCCRTYLEGDPARAELPILVSGGRAWAGVAEAAAMRDWLVERGVSPSRLQCEAESQTTWENALYSSRILSQAGIDRIALITSDFHLPRALGLFQARGLAVEPIPAPTQAGPWGRWKNHAREWGASRLTRIEAWRR